MKRKPEYVDSTGNVLADLGLPNPEEALAKAALAHRISKVIEQRRLTQAQAARLLGVDQPKVSALIRGRLSLFSLDRLLRYLMLLGHDVEISVKSRPRSRDESRLRVA
jgi:predicted XRE-type DNA-binding protein